MAQSEIQGKSLRERRTEETRADIVATAMPLFLEQGYDATSMEEVADATGVSRRTLYRYFGTKDDIVFDVPRLWLEHLRGTVETREPGEATRDLLRRGIVALSQAMEDDAERVLAGLTLVATSETLMARRGLSDADWIEYYVGLMVPDVAGSLEGIRQALVCAMVLVAGQNAALLSWGASYPEQKLEDVAQATLDQLDSAWPNGCR